MKLIERTEVTYWADYKRNALIRWNTNGDDMMHAQIGNERHTTFVAICEMPIQRRRVVRAGTRRRWRDGFSLRLRGQLCLLVARIS